MDKLKYIIKENLNKRYQMNESLEKIKLVEDTDLQYNMLVGKLGQIIDEGTNNSQSKEIIEEQLMDWVKHFFNTDKGEIQRQNKGNLSNTAISGAGSQFQEWIYGKFLNMLGLEGKLADFVATTLSEVGIMELIDMFRGKYNCTKTATILVNSVGEGLFRLAIENGLKQNGIIANYIRNTVMEYLKSQGYTQKIGTMVCSMIEKNKPSILKGIGI